MDFCECWITFSIFTFRASLYATVKQQLSFLANDVIEYSEGFVHMWDEKKENMKSFYF